MRTSPRTRVERDSAALTFDDGPSPWTDAALEQLDRADVRATFFVTPRSGCGGIVGRIAAAGHEVGYHCGIHVRHSDRRREDVRAEARADLAWLADLGIAPRSWRTPWGDLADWSVELAAELGLGLWGWSDDTEDWSGRATGSMLADLEASLQGGSVVLMHDGVGPGARRDDCAATVDLIAPLAELCRSRGLEPVALGAGERSGGRRDG